MPAQTLAQRIASTPHMMGGNMKYNAWLVLKAPEVKDEAAAKKAEEALRTLEGIKQVVTYPKQQSIGVQFEAKGKLTSAALIDALSEAGIKAANH